MKKGLKVILVQLDKIMYRTNRPEGGLHARLILNGISGSNSEDLELLPKSFQIWCLDRGLDESRDEVSFRIS